MTLQNLTPSKKRQGGLLLLLILLALSLTMALAQGGNSITSPDTAGNVGLFTSLALDSSGYPIVAYLNASNNDLKLMHCSDPNCTGSDESITSPDTAGSVGFTPSLALDNSGHPVVSYYHAGNGDLKLMHCNDPNCDGGDESITSPDTAGRVGVYTSLALDSSGHPVVSYYDATNFGDGDLKLMHCNDPNCTGDDESITSPDTAGNVGEFTSLVLDGSGHPVVSYFDSSKSNLKIMHCNDPNCDGDDESTTSPDTAGFAGQYTSLVLDSSGHPVVSYTSDRNTNLRIMHCNDSNCAGGDESITSPDTTSRFGNYTSLQLDSSGYPVISYWDTANGDLRVMHCNDPNCTGGDESMTAPDTAGIVGDYTSLVLDSDGYPLISYYDLSNGDLKLLHCGDANCMISNTAPTVEAGRPYEGLPNNAIALSDASASDSDGDGLSYSWTVDSGACTFSDATALNPNLTCTASGNVTVTLTVDDGTDTASDSATVTVITPQQAISNLQSDIQSLVDNGTLKPGQANGLSKPLDNAIRSLDKGNTADACDQLQDFIDEVNAKTPDPLDAGTAAGLLDAAEAIRVAVGCS